MTLETLSVLHEVCVLSSAFGERLRGGAVQVTFLADLEPVLHPCLVAGVVLCSLRDHNDFSDYRRVDGGAFLFHPVFKDLYESRVGPTGKLMVQLKLQEKGFEVRSTSESSPRPWVERCLYATDTSTDCVQPPAQDPGFLNRSVRSLHDYARKLGGDSSRVKMGRFFSEGICGVELYAGLWVMCGERKDWVIFDPARFARAPRVKDREEIVTATRFCVLTTPRFHDLILKMDPQGRTLPRDPKNELVAREILRELVQDRTDQTVGGTNLLDTSVDPRPFLWQRLLPSQ